MKKINQITIWTMLAAGLTGLSACGSDPTSTGYEYAPEMYHSIPLEPYTQIDGVYSPFKDSLNAQEPPAGTIAWDGHAPYNIPNNDTTGRPLADKITTNPVLPTERALAWGDTLYRRYCGLCHGKNLKGEAGDGPLAKRDEINPPDLTTGDQANFSAGRIYYTIMYGKNAMGSYASQLTWEDRWKVIHHIQKIQHPERYENLGPDGLPKAKVITVAPEEDEAKNGNGH